MGNNCKGICYSDNQSIIEKNYRQDDIEQKGIDPKAQSQNKPDFSNNPENHEYSDLRQIDGTTMTFTLDNGAVYTGQMLNNMRHNYGIQVWPDGSKYEGQWKNDHADGKGKLHHVIFSNDIETKKPCRSLYQFKDRW